MLDREKGRKTAQKEMKDWQISFEIAVGYPNTMTLFYSSRPCSITLSFTLATSLTCEQKKIQNCDQTPYL